MSGWIKLHRSLSEHWLWDFKSPEKAMAWVDLLMMARHSEGQIMLKGRVVKLGRSQIGVSQISLQKRWKWSQNKVKRFLKLLENEGMCNLETNDLTTIITICNFDSYQAGSQLGERPDEQANERPDERNANDQSNDDIRRKEGKKGKNDKKTTSVDYSVFGMSDEQVDEVKRIRKKNKGGAITQRVADALAKEFHKACSAGFSFDELLTEWEVRGWKAFKAEWIKRSNQNETHQQNSTSGETKREATRRQLREDTLTLQRSHEQPNEPNEPILERDGHGLWIEMEHANGAGRQ